MRKILRLLFAIMLIAIGSISTVFAVRAIKLNKEDGEFAKLYSTERLIVYVNEEYKDRFLKKEINAEDFNWDNVYDITLYEWDEETACGKILFNLKETGRRQIEEAKSHIEKLSFVKEVSYCMAIEGVRKGV